MQTLHRRFIETSLPKIMLRTSQFMICICELHLNTIRIDIWSNGDHHLYTLLIEFRSEKSVVEYTVSIQLDSRHHISRSTGNACLPEIIRINNLDWISEQGQSPGIQFLNVLRAIAISLAPSKKCVEFEFTRRFTSESEDQIDRLAISWGLESFNRNTLDEFPEKPW